MERNDALKLNGIVIAKKANYLIVETQASSFKLIPEMVSLREKSLRFLCIPRRRLIHKGVRIHVGDKVSLESIDLNLNRAVITALEPRKNLLKRPPVANVTNIIIACSVIDPAFDFFQASRFLLTAEQISVHVDLLLTKSDLISDDDLKIMVNRLESWGYSPFAISIKSGEGIDSLLKEIKLGGNLTVLCGPSGVGKSSLLNYILPNARINVGNLSGKLKRGRHTTRHVELYSLDNNVLLADTPGFNKPEFDVEPINLQFLFPEMRNLLANNSCKFRDCLHLDEPGCCIDSSMERYFHYKYFLNEILNSHH